MNGVRRHFTVPQRTLHWVMAVCILAMLFIGVGMVSTIMPKYLTLVSIHKPLGIAILVLALLRLVVRLGYGAPKLPRRSAHAALECAFLSGLRVLCADPVACRGGAVSLACPP